MKENDKEFIKAMDQIVEKYGMNARTRVNEIISDALSKDQPLTNYEVLYVAELLFEDQGNLNR